MNSEITLLVQNCDICRPFLPSQGKQQLIPGTTATGMTISNTSDSGTGTIFFGDTTSSSAAGFRYNHNTGDNAASSTGTSMPINTSNVESNASVVMAFFGGAV